MYRSMFEWVEAFEKWHRSWKSYKRPRQIRIEWQRPSSAWLQDPLPDYLKEAKS